MWFYVISSRHSLQYQRQSSPNQPGPELSGSRQSFSCYPPAWSRLCCVFAAPRHTQKWKCKWEYVIFLHTHTHTHIHMHICIIFRCEKATTLNVIWFDLTKNCISEMNIVGVRPVKWRLIDQWIIPSIIELGCTSRLNKLFYLVTKAILLRDAIKMSTLIMDWMGLMMNYIIALFLVDFVMNSN